MNNIHTNSKQRNKQGLGSGWYLPLRHRKGCHPNYKADFLCICCSAIQPKEGKILMKHEQKQQI